MEEMMDLKKRIEKFEKLAEELNVFIENIYINAIKPDEDEDFTDWWTTKKGNNDDDVIILDCWNYKHYMSNQYELPIKIFEKLKKPKDYKNYVESLKKKALQTTVFEIIENEENT